MIKPHYRLGLDGGVTRIETPHRLLQARALAGLREAGLSLPEWARANGLKVGTVKALLYGHARGHRGEAHRAAIALGMKKGRCEPPVGFAPLNGGVQ